ncbi:hypothetical protein O181_073728, partial [Austropuccinia psidii MF-1]|nr:hypothetical protein [Austropuccinia psidii MF-1]
IYIEASEMIDIKSNRGRFLQNMGDLVQCTRIASTPIVRDGHAGRFFNAYNRYTTSSRELFNNPRIKPNHHLALHIPEQLKVWGPMMGVAEFAGERMIGKLQRVPTNRKIGEMHGTILKKALATQRLVGGYSKIEDVCSYDEAFGGVRGNVIEVGLEVYERMLALLRQNEIEVRNCADFPHPPNSFILSRYAKTLRSLSLPKDSQVVSMMPPNNVVYYKSEGHLQGGQIKGLYSFRGPPSLGNQTGVLIQIIKNRYACDRYPPGHIGYYLKLLGVLVGRLSSKTVMINATDILSLCAYRLIDSDILKIPLNGIMLCPYNRCIPF